MAENWRPAGGSISSILLFGGEAGGGGEVSKCAWCEEAGDGGRECLEV